MKTKMAIAETELDDLFGKDTRQELNPSAVVAPVWEVPKKPIPLPPVKSNGRQGSPKGKNREWYEFNDYIADLSILMPKAIDVIKAQKRYYGVSDNQAVIIAVRAGLMQMMRVVEKKAGK